MLNLDNIIYHSNGVKFADWFKFLTLVPYLSRLVSDFSQQAMKSH